MLPKVKLTAVMTLLLASFLPARAAEQPDLLVAQQRALNCRFVNEPLVTHHLADRPPLLGASAGLIVSFLRHKEPPAGEANLLPAVAVSHSYQLQLGPLVLDYQELFKWSVDDGQLQGDIQLRKVYAELVPGWQVNDEWSLAGGLLVSGFINYGAALNSRTTISKDLSRLSDSPSLSVVAAELNKLVYHPYDLLEAQQDATYGFKLSLSWQPALLPNLQLRSRLDYRYQRGFFSGNSLGLSVGLDYQLASQQVDFQFKPALAVQLLLGSSWRDEEGLVDSVKLQLAASFSWANCYQASGLNFDCRIVVKNEQELFFNQQTWHYWLRFNLQTELLF